LFLLFLLFQALELGDFSELVDKAAGAWPNEQVCEFIVT
jgi:hypothetical protein